MAERRCACCKAGPKPGKKDRGTPGGIFVSRALVESKVLCLKCTVANNVLRTLHSRARPGTRQSARVEPLTTMPGRGRPKGAEEHLDGLEEVRMGSLAASPVVLFVPASDARSRGEHLSPNLTTASSRRPRAGR